jgi:hypothetical protein
MEDRHRRRSRESPLGKLEDAAALVRRGGHIVQLDRAKLVAAAEEEL